MHSTKARAEVAERHTSRASEPVVLGRDGTLTTSLLPGFELPVDELLGRPAD